MITIFALQDCPQGYMLSYFYKLPRALSLSRMLVEFFSNFYIPPCVGKIIKFMELTFLENPLIWGIFTRTPRHSKLAPKFLPSRPRQKKITHFPRQQSFENLFPLTIESGGGNYDLLYQNSVRNMKMAWSIRFFIFCMICKFFKSDGFTVL